MMNRHNVLLALLTFVLCGCHSYQTIQVRTFDIETRELLYDVTVHVRYVAWDFDDDLTRPRDKTFNAGRDGVTRIRVARNWPWKSIFISVPGYASRGYATSGGSILKESRIEDGQFLPMMSVTDPNGRNEWPSILIGEVWREPDPRFIVIVPDQFRGALYLHFDHFCAHSFKKGEREYIVRADAQGVVRLPLTKPIRTSTHPGDLVFRFESGDEIPKMISRTTFGRDGKMERSRAIRLSDDAIAVRRIFLNGRECLVVGSRELADSIRTGSYDLRNEISVNETVRLKSH